MKNKGFSLIELIVVIAIMAVAMAIGGYALSAVSLANAKSCANEINSALEMTRTHACSSDNQSNVKFYRESDGTLMMKKNYEGVAKKIGSKVVILEYSVDDGKNYEKVTDTTGITFTFNRSSGAFTSEYDSLRISSGGKRYTIICYLLTGKTKME